MSFEPLRVFIGFDERQPVAYSVLQHSLLRRASRPLAITPLVLGSLPLTRRGLTPFTFSRFLVPWLSGWRGWALFLDLDMLVLGDIAELFDHSDERRAVVVCREQQRFEWSSALLFNCAHPANRVLTPDFVEDATRCRRPHDLDWLAHDDGLIGGFPAIWNHCVGYNAPESSARLVHFTQGIPAFPETKGCEHSEAWFAELRDATSTQPWTALMGGSVHAQRLPDGRVLPKLHPDARAYRGR